jgi:hypothetical protein
MSVGIWRLSCGPTNVQNPSVLLGREWEKCNQIPYSPFDGQFDEREQLFCSFLLSTRFQQFFCNIHPKPNQADTASSADVFAPQPEPRNEALQTDLQEGFCRALFPEEDIEEHMAMNLVPVRSYRVNLRVRKVRKGKLKLVYEEEVEREEL